MKTALHTLFSTSAILVSLNAFAYPAKGDNATYEVSSVSQGQTVNLIMVDTITAIDPTNGDMTIKQSIQLNGVEVQSQEQVQTLAKLQNLTQLIDHCLQLPAQYSAKLETISVPYGTVNTCHITVTQQSGVVDQWIGKVPFAIVQQKVTATDGSVALVALKASNVKF